MSEKAVVESLDYERARVIITTFIKQYVEDSGANGVVVGVSGGVDSTVAVSMAVEALGSGRVLGLFMPSVYTPSEDWEDARHVAEVLGIQLKIIDINPIVDCFARAIPDFGEDKLARGNLMPRIRMSILYYYANRYNLLVLGSSDRSEILLGYFTKYGDGAADIMPLASLYKTQVREMARRLGFIRIAQKPSSPRLWSGHTAEGELGAPYELIDQVLYAIFDRKLPVEEVRKNFGDVVDFVLERVRKNLHKSNLPPSPDLSSVKK